MTVDTVIPVTWQKQQGYGAGLTVTGLEGGHSGSEIDKEHANANILMGRVLKYLSDRMELAVVSLAGGLKIMQSRVSVRQRSSFRKRKKQNFPIILQNWKRFLKKSMLSQIRLSALK